MQLKQLLPILFILFCNAIVAQQPNYNQLPEFLNANSVWVFGMNAGLDFNNGGPVPIHTEMRADEGCASVADPGTGELLFYSNGGTVWNANHQVMPNGDSLLGSTSSAQGVCIVPVINDPGKYYLFSLSGETSGGPKVYDTTANGSPLIASLFYNIIDMDLENGLGDVVAGQKNIPLDDDDLFEGMIAVPGNDCDVWLIVHSKFSAEFRAYHITRNGIDTIPVVSSTGNIAGQGAGGYRIGSMAISPDRQRIAIVNNGVFAAGLVELGQFNPNNGEVDIEMSVYEFLPYGVCFSPDGSKLYINDGLYGLIQFDLSTYDSLAIVNSQYSVSSYMGPAFYDVSGLRLYNDSIYLSRRNTSLIGRINKPNLPGSACDFQADAIQLLTGDIARHSLNNDVILPLPPDTTMSLTLDTVVCKTVMTLTAPQGFSDYEWYDGSTSSTKTINTPGTYWVISKDFCYPRIDTFIISEFDFPIPVINVNVLELGIVGTFSYNSYQWLLDGNAISGANQRTYTVSENGDYQVVVTNEEGCIDTSAVYKVTNADGTGVAHTPEGAKISVYPNPATEVVYIRGAMNYHIDIASLEGKIMMSVDNAKEISLSTLSAGIYLMQIRNKNGQLIKVQKIVKN